MAGETPPPAPVEAAPAPAKQAPPGQAQVAAVQREQAKQGGERAQAAQAGQPDAQEAEKILAQLGLDVKTAPKEGAAPLTVEHISESLAKATPDQLLALDATISASVTEAEKTALQNKYTTNGSPDWKALGADLAQGKLTVRELVVFSAMLDSGTSIPEDAKPQFEQAGQRLKMLQEGFQNQLKPKYEPAAIDALFKKPEYQDAYGRFLNDGNKEEFLKAVTDDNDRTAIEWAITSAPTVEEKKTVAEKFKDLLAKDAPAQAIAQALVSDPPQMNYREGMVAKALLDDLQKAAQSQDKIPDELKGVGIVGLLGKLIEKLSKIIEKITGELDKQFRKKPGAVEQSNAPQAPAEAPAQTPAEAAPETLDQKMARIFEGMTPDGQAALKAAKAKDVADGTLPDSLKDNDRAKKIVAKLKENGAAEATVDPNQTVRDFIAAHPDKDWDVK